MEQNNTGKYLKYALGEILLVMIGILLALQVNNWNEERKIQADEQQLLASLKTDLTISLKQIERKIYATNHIQYKDSTTLILIKERNISIDIDSLMNLLTGYNAPPTFDPESGTINEIINSGKSNIISNLDLRRFISSWSSYMNEIKETESTFGSFFHNRKAPYLSKYIPYRNGNSELFGKSNFEIDKSAIFSSLEFENMVRESWIWCNNLRFRYEILREHISEMLKILEADLIKN
jgi:hypothetical protein